MPPSIALHSRLLLLVTTVAVVLGAWTAEVRAAGGGGSGPGEHRFVEDGLPCDAFVRPRTVRLLVTGDPADAPAIGGIGAAVVPVGEEGGLISVSDHVSGLGARVPRYLLFCVLRR